MGLLTPEGPAVDAEEALKRFRGIAQLVEQRSPKPRAEGSNPSAPAIKSFTIFIVFDIMLQCRAKKMAR